MKIVKDTVIFSTGTEKKANRGIIGISPDLEITEGYDGPFYTKREEWMDDDDYNGLTRDEQVELADYMIAAWAKFKREAE